MEVYTVIKTVIISAIVTLIVMICLWLYIGLTVGIIALSELQRPNEKHKGGKWKNIM